jgi:hypothetical protein
MTTATAMARIEMSRARLRAAMQAPHTSTESAGAPNSWFNELKDVPYVGAVVQAVHSWWIQHPLRPVSMVISHALAVVTRPVAQRSPVTLVLVAAAGGAVLVWSRPWRWIFRSALLAGLGPQIISRVIAKLPIESWMTLLAASMAQADAHTAGAPSTNTDRDPPIATN